MWPCALQWEVLSFAGGGGGGGSERGQMCADGGLGLRHELGRRPIFR